MLDRVWANEFYESMRAAMLIELKTPLELRDVEVPRPGPGEVLIRVEACGVCRTDLHIVDGELPAVRLPLIPGHQIVGRVIELGSGVTDFVIGQRVGVPWLGFTCQSCRFCKLGLENLCDRAEFTGYTRHGGFAEFVAANAHYVFPLTGGKTAVELAPLLCAGLIGYRAFTRTQNAERIGIFGFGAAAHIITQVAVALGRRVYAFTRVGDLKGQEFARSLGAVWAGDSCDSPPDELDAAIIFAPVGELVPRALAVLRKGGIVVCAGIHMTDIPSFPYRYLWEERTVTSVANLTRKDGIEFFELISKVPVKTSVTVFSLEEVNQALAAIREGKLNGSAVLKIAADD